MSVYDDIINEKYKKDKTKTTIRKVGTDTNTFNSITSTTNRDDNNSMYNSIINGSYNKNGSINNSNNNVYDDIINGTFKRKYENTTKPSNTETAISSNNTSSSKKKSPKDIIAETSKYVPQSSTTNNSISNRPNLAQDLVKNNLTGEYKDSNNIPKREVNERVNVIMNGGKLSSLKTEEDKEKEAISLNYQKELANKANTVKNPIEKLGRIVQNLYLGSTSSLKQGIYYATDVEALNSEGKAKQLVSIKSNQNLPQIIKDEYINQETQNDFASKKMKKDVTRNTKFIFKDRLEKEANEPYLSKESKDKITNELDSYRDSFGNIEVNPARRALSDSIEEDQLKIQNNVNEISGTFAKKVAELAPSMGNSLTGAGISFINPYLGTSYFILTAMGSYEYEAKKLGMTNEQARNYGMIMGFMEGATEMFSIDKVVKMGKAASKGMLKETLKNFGLDMLDNAIQEALIDPIDELVKYGITGNTENDYSTVEGGRKLVAQMIQDGFDGALTAMITGGVEAGLGSSLHIYDKIKNGETPTKNEIVKALKDIKNSKKVDIVDKFKQSFDYQKQKLLKNDGQIYTYIEQSENGNISAVNEAIGKNIELTNKELVIQPAVVLIDGYYNVIDSSSGLKLDTTKYDSLLEAETSFNNKINNIDNATVNRINQEVTKSQLNILQYIEELNNSMYEAGNQMKEILKKDFEESSRDYVSSIERNTKNENKITFDELSTSINQLQDKGKYDIEQARSIFDYVANNIDNVYHQVTPSGTDFLYTKDNSGNITNQIKLSKSKYTGSEIKESINNILRDANLSSMKQETMSNTANSNQNKKSSTFYNPEENYAVSNIKKVIEAFSKQNEYTKKELADIWNNEINANEYDVKYDSEGNIQSYIAIEEDGNNLVLKQYDNDDNIVKSEAILGKKGKYNSEAITNAIEKVSSLYDENRPIKGQQDIESNEVRNMRDNIDNERSSSSNYRLQLPSKTKTTSNINNSVTQNKDIIKSIENFKKAKNNVERQDLLNIASNIEVYHRGSTFIDSQMQNKAGKNQKPKIIEIDKFFKTYSDKEDLRKKAYYYALDTYKNKTISIKDINTNVDISQTGIKKTFNKNQDNTKMQTANNLPNIIEEGIYLNSSKSTKNSNLVYHYFFTPISVKGNNELALVTIKEDTSNKNNNHKFYYHDIREIIKTEKDNVQAMPHNKVSNMLFEQNLSQVNNSIPQKTKIVKGENAVTNNDMQNTKNNTSDDVRSMKKGNSTKSTNISKIKSVDDIELKYKEQTDYIILNEDSDYINVRNLVIKENLRNNGIGQNILNDIMEYANKTRKTITLTPTNAFNTKTKLKQWYKKNGFVENSGKNADFTISDTMYKVPEINNTQKATDNQGRQLSKQQQEFFLNSKVRDKNGNLKTVYHGTDTKFTIFNYDYLGKNGTANGKGFYLADDINVAKSYSDGKNIIEAYVDIQKPLSIGKTTISENDYIKFLEKVNDKTNGSLFTDYGDGEKIQKNSNQYNEIINQFKEEYSYGGDDVDLVLSILNSANITLEDGYRLLKNTIGYDGIIVEANYKNNDDTISYTQYIPLTPEQIKNVDNINPTNNKDIRFAKRTSKDKVQRNAERADSYIEQEIQKIEKTGKWDDTIPVTKLTDIRRTLENYLGLGVQKGHFREQAYGIYKTNRDVIRTKEFKDMDTILHETGHALDLGNRLKIDKESIASELLTAINKLGGYENETRQVQLDEGFAEIIREYSIIPEQTKLEYPQTVAILEGIRKNDKSFNNFITKVQEQTYNYIHQNPRNRTLSNISIGEQTDKIPLTKELIKETVMKTMYDKDYALKSAVNQFSKGQKVNASDNAYYLTRLVNSIGDKVTSILSEGYIDENGKRLFPGLNKIGEILGDNAERYNDLRAYLVAQRDTDYKTKALKTGIRTSDSKYVIEQFKNDTQITEAAQLIYDTLDGILQYVVNNNLISQEQANKLKESNTFYVPMQRVLNENGNNIGRKGAVTDIIKKRTGSELDVKDVLENIIANATNMIQQVENNNILKAFYKEGEASGLTSAIYDVIPAPVKKVGTETLFMWKNELKKQGVDTSNLDLEKTIDIFVPDNKVDTKNLITSFINDNGQRVYLQFTDKVLFNSLMNLDTESTSKLLKLSSNLNMPLRYGATMANLGFAIPNMISDTAQAAIFSTAGFIPVIDNALGVIEILGATNTTARNFLNKVAPNYAQKINYIYTLYNQSGATSGTRIAQERKSIQKLMKEIYGTKNSETLGIQEKYKPLKRLLDLLTYLPELSEQSTRFRVFEKNYDYYKNKGNSEMDTRILAALESRDATQDFSRMGTISREINKVIPFSAARMGSTYTFAEKVKANPKQVGMRIALLTTVAMAIKALGYDDDEIDELNQRKKDDNFILKVGDNVITIKKPQGILRSTINFAEYIQDLITGHIEEGKEGERLAEWLNNAIMDNMPADEVTGLVPNAVAPLIENAINKDFYYNTDIVNSYDLDLPNDMQYYEYNSQLAILLGKVFNYSPAKIDNLISGYFGGLGTQVTNIMDYALGKMGVINEKTEMGAESNSVGKRFIVNVNSNSASLDEIYNKQTELTQKSNSEEGLTDKETIELANIKNAVTNISKINKQIKEIKKDLTMNGKEKAEEIKELQKQRTDLARQALGKNVIYAENTDKNASIQFYTTSSELKKNGYSLPMTSDMKKEYEQIAYDYYSKYENQKIYSEDKLENIKTKAKDYAKNYMFKKYKNNLVKTNK